MSDVHHDEFDFDASSLEDDQLRMLFTCCHPALAPEARMALTLRSVAGLTVPEIARGFLSSESAMERRLTRARNKVTHGGIPFRVPPDELLVERLAGVLRVVYLVFNEGHAATARGELRAEAIRLARLLVRLMPDEAEVRGLLALLLLTDARSEARVSDGGLVSLADQDRGLWSRAADRRGRDGARARAAAAAAWPVRDPGRDRRAALAGAVDSPPPTGRRSPGSTRSSRATIRRRWSRSTARWPSGSRTGRRRASPLLPDDARLDALRQPLHAARASCCGARVTSPAPDAALGGRDRALRHRGRAEALRRLGERRGGTGSRRRDGRTTRSAPAQREPGGDQQRGARSRRRTARRGVAAGAGEDRDGDRDPEHAAELAQRAVDARGLAERGRRDGVDGRAGRGRASPSRRPRPRPSAPGTSSR